MAAVGRHWRQRMLRRPRIFRDRRNPLDLYDDTDIIRKFRLSREKIFLLCDEVHPFLAPAGQRGGSLPVCLQVCLTLRYLATGTFQDAVGELIGVSQPTVSRTVQRVVSAIVQLRPQYERPPTQDEAQQSMELFEEIAGVPGVFACIDGTHVKVLAPPPEEAGAFINRKNFFSINVMIVCDASLRIFCCSANSPGGFHDARVLRLSPFWRGMEGGQIVGQVLGDSAYPHQNWLMPPVARPVDYHQEAFNVAHRRTRVKVENCIGVLKRRWHCLHTELRLRPARCSRLIHCCVILHNKALNVPIPDDVPELPEIFVPNPPRQAERVPLAALAIRDRIIANYF